MSRPIRQSDDFQGFLRALKRIVDDHNPGGTYYTNGPMRIEFYSFLDDKHKERRGVKISSGWDENYGGWVAVEASPTGKSLRVTHSDEVRVTGDAEVPHV